jgi:hypothetical protein
MAEFAERYINPFTDYGFKRLFGKNLIKRSTVRMSDKNQNLLQLRLRVAPSLTVGNSRDKQNLR